MSERLLRLKPSPIPEVSVVSEHLADSRLKAVYEDTKQVLQAPWMGVVAMAFAWHESFYAALWGGLRELAGSEEFVAACRRLRAVAEEEAGRLSPTPLRDTLRSNGYSDPELEEIAHLIEIFSHGNMPYLLMATTARLLLEGRELSRERETTRFEGRHGPAAGRHLVLIEPHHADADTRGLYDDIRATLGLPFVNTDYRALARWPSYLRLAWEDLAPRVNVPTYEPAVARIHDAAVDLSLSLPNPGGLSAEVLRDAVASGKAESVLDLVRLFQWLLPGLVLNVAAFRAQLLV